MNGGSGMDGRADGQGRVYQASGDQHIIEHHHHGGSVSATADPVGIESVRRPTGGRAPQVFRDRTDLMERLHGAVASGGGDEIYVLHGMGGCGKTAVAHALFQYATDVVGRIGLWVNASDRATLRSGMLAVAADRGAEEGQLLAARNGLRAAADLVWDRLGASAQPWLLVLDNADNPAVLQDGWLRSSPRGTVLVTTRQAAARWWTNAELHHVGVLPSDAAAQVLCDLAPETGTVEEAKAVADRLGRLPLALTLAGGFLAHQVIEPWTMAKYGQHLVGPEQVGILDEGAAALPGDESRNLVSRTWQLSLDSLTAQGLPESTVLLRLLACFGADPLPLSLLSGLDTGGLLSRTRAEVALRGLLDQSLVSLVDAGVRCVQSHGVLIASVTSGTPAEALQELHRAAVQLLGAVVPAVPERGPQDLRLRLLAPHALALLQRTDRAVTPDALNATVRLAVALHRTGDYLSAWELTSASAAVAEPVLGAEHRLLLRARSREGRALFRLGRFEEAETLLRRVLADQERLFGSEDADSLDTCYGLSLALQPLDRGAEGLEILQRCATGREGVLGPEHPLTLRAQSALLLHTPVSQIAAWMDGNEPSHPQRCEQYIGGEHSVTLGAQFDYAVVLFKSQRHEAADVAAKKIREQYELRYGLSHPVTLAAQTLYARTRAASGDLSTALCLMSQVARQRERSVGAEHPHTAASYRYLEEFEAKQRASEHSPD